MPIEIRIERYSGQAADHIFALILPIQQDEFGLPVTREKQPDLEHIASFYQQGAGDFWLALAGEDVIGTIALKDIGNAQVALRKMFVRADFRGKAHGIAQRLLETAIAAARQRQITDILLGTTPFFHAAHRFYEKNSFTEIAKETLPSTFPIMDVDTKFYRLRLP